MDTTKVTQQQEVTNWEVINISKSCNRRFNCNAIQFWNLGTSNVKINDFFILKPNTPLILQSLKNEVDKSNYKITIAPESNNIVQVWVKTNAGVPDIDPEDLAAGLRPAPDRRQQMKDKEEEKKRR